MELWKVIAWTFVLTCNPWVLGFISGLRKAAAARRKSRQASQESAQAWELLD
jgi:hypothetical protein